MKEEINNIIKLMIQQVVDHVPEYGDFTPVMEFFVNPDVRTQEFVGKYGLKVYKMPKDIVPDKIPVLGIVDDIAVIYLAWKYVADDLELYQDWRKANGLEVTDFEEAPAAE